MDFLNRRFLGRFESAHPRQPPAPRIGVSAIADVGLTTRTVHFLIDTGADRTLIAPRDARGLFGDEEYEDTVCQGYTEVHPLGQRCLCAVGTSADSTMHISANPLKVTLMAASSFNRTVAIA